MKKPKKIAAGIYENKERPVTKTFFGEPSDINKGYTETHSYHLQLNAPLSDVAISKIQKSVERFARKY